MRQKEKEQKLKYKKLKYKKLPQFSKIAHKCEISHDVKKNDKIPIFYNNVQIYPLSVQIWGMFAMMARITK